MRTTLTALAVLLGLAGGSPGADPIVDLFRYKPRRRRWPETARRSPPTIGPEATWYGQFIGMRYDDFSRQLRRYFAAGLLRDETSCRIWQQRAVTYCRTAGGSSARAAVLGQPRAALTRYAVTPSLARRCFGTASGSGGTALR